MTQHKVWKNVLAALALAALLQPALPARAAVEQRDVTHSQPLPMGRSAAADQTADHPRSRNPS